MWSFLSAALSAIPSAATSQLALIAYCLALVTYLVTVWRVVRNRNLLQNLQRLPAKDRLSALELEMGGVRLSAGISPEQWLRSKIHRYYFLSFIVTCVVGVIVFALAILNSHGTVDISVDLYQKSSTEVPNTKSLLGSLVTRASISKTIAAEAEFVDPDTVPRNATRPSIEDTRLRYDYQKRSDKITISPILGYADKQRNGEIIQGLHWRHEPFVWEFPKLSVKIANNTNRDILLSEVVFTVSDSVEDKRPIIVVRTGTSGGNLHLRNEGWGPVSDPVVKFDVGIPCPRSDPTSSFKETLTLSTFLRGTSFSIEKYVADSIKRKICRKGISRDDCELVQVCVPGQLEYTNLDGTKSKVRFVTYVILGDDHRVGAPLPPSYAYEVFLEPGKKGYTQRRSISQVIKPGEVDHFLFKIATSRSANFKFSMDILSSGGKKQWTGDFDMSVLVPRTGAEIASKDLAAAEAEQQRKARVDAEAEAKRIAAGSSFVEEAAVSGEPYRTIHQTTGIEDCSKQCVWDSQCKMFAYWNNKACYLFDKIFDTYSTTASSVGYFTGSRPSGTD
jgi:hypothetical protein